MLYGCREDSTMRGRTDATMTDEEGQGRGRGREATTAAILDAAEELFSAHGFSAVTVRDIAERAGVSHALVHRYLGSKDDIYRAVLKRGEHGILQAAPGIPDILETASLMLREGLGERRQYVRLIAHSALHGLSYDRTSGRFAATERLIDLAESAVASASPAERAEKDIDPRLVVACVVSLFLGWAAAESWVLPAAGVQDMDEANLIDGLEHVILGILKDNLPGLDRSDTASG
jgi:AcrR family transcriptional regulator